VRGLPDSTAQAGVGASGDFGVNANSHRMGASAPALNPAHVEELQISPPSSGARGSQTAIRTCRGPQVAPLRRLPRASRIGRPPHPRRPREQRPRPRRGFARRSGHPSHTSVSSSMATKIAPASGIVPGKVGARLAPALGSNTPRRSACATIVWAASVNTTPHLVRQRRSKPGLLDRRRTGGRVNRAA
jgi:hypothetical protein